MSVDQPVPGPTRPWTFDVEYVGGAQRTDYGTGTEDDGQWQWAIFNGPPEQMGSLVLLGMAEDEDPTPVLAALVADHNRSVVPGPTREQQWATDEYETSRVNGPDGYRIRCYEANGTEFSTAVAVRVAAALNGLLPARPSPTDDASDIVAEYKAALTPTEPTAEQIAECDADRCGGGCIVCEGPGMPLFAPSDIRRLLAEIERLRARPCPWVRGETTQWCALAAGTEPTEEPT